MAYQSRPYDRRAHTARMSDLLRYQGDVAAEGDLRRSQNLAQGITQTGSIVSGAMRDLAQLPAIEAEQDARRVQADLNQQKLDATKQDTRDQQTARDIQRLALKPTEDGGVTFDRDVLQREYLAAGLGDRLPDLLKTFDAADDRMRTLQAAKRDALAALGSAVQAGGNSPEAFELAVEYAVQNGALAAPDVAPYLEAVRADPSKIGQIASVLTGKAPAAPRTREVTTRDTAGNETIRIVEDTPGQSFTSAAARATGGDFDAYVTRLEEETGRPLSRQDLLTARAQWNAAGRAPDKPGGDITPAQRAQAERWRVTELRRLDEQRRDPMGTMTDRDYADARAAIEASFRQQSGAPPEPPLTVQRPPAGSTALAERGGDVPGAEDAPSPSLGARPATAAPRPAPPAAPAAPAGARQAPPKVGDIVTVRGQRVRVTAIGPDGRIQGEPVP